MGTLIAEDLHHRRLAGHSPYALPRERECRCPVPGLRIPEAMDDKSSLREDIHFRRQTYLDAAEATCRLAAAVASATSDDPRVPAEVRASWEVVATACQDLAEWRAELEGKR